MPGRRKRDPAPFWWAVRSYYYFQVGKRQIKLCPDPGKARRLAHNILAEAPRATEPPATAEDSTPLVVELCDGFLDRCKAHKAPLTYAAYKRRGPR